MDYIRQYARYGSGICILLLAFIFSPVLSLQPDAHPGALYVVPIAVLIIILATMSGIVRLRTIDVLALLLFVIASFGTLISDKGCFNSGLLKFFVFVLLFISTSSFALTPKQLNFSFTAYLYLSIAIAILIVLSFIFGYPHIEQSSYQGRYSVGITGIFKNPNYLSSFYNISFFVLCYVLTTVHLVIKKKLIIISLLALFVVATFFTGTRAALLTEAFVLTLMLLITEKKKHLYKLIPLAVLVAFVVIYYWTTISDLYDLFVAGRELTNDTLREDSWRYAFEHIKQNPILGCGHNSWSIIHMGKGNVDEYLHNIFLELLLDQGVIGCILVFFIIFTGFNKTKKKDKPFLFILLLCSGFPMLFQNGLYEVNFWRFIIINRLMMNISSSYEGGIDAFLKRTYGAMHNTITSKMYPNQTKQQSAL